MKTNRLLNLTLTLLLFTFGKAVFAQQKTIKVWPDKIPGAIENSSYQLEKNEDETWIKKVASPTLDFYPAPIATSNGTAVIICPGGGYSGLAINHEGTQVAAWLNSLGITAFVLKYRLPSDLIMTEKNIGPLQDGQEAMRLVRRHAQEWKIDPDKIGIMGFSAGGHLASTISTHFNEETYNSQDNTSVRPDFSLLIYPVISMDSKITHTGSRNNLLGANASQTLIDHFSNELQVTKETPPAFLVHSLDDKVVPVENSINYLLALKKMEVPGELHIYENGGHGYGLGKENTTNTSWPKTCEKWLLMHGFL